MRNCPEVLRPAVPFWGLSLGEGCHSKCLTGRAIDTTAGIDTTAAIDTAAGIATWTTAAVDATSIGYARSRGDGRVG